MKAILVIETDAKHIEDLYVEHIWNDFVLIDLGKEYHFKPMTQKIESGKNEDGTKTNIPIPCEHFAMGWNACIDAIIGDTDGTKGEK